MKVVEPEVLLHARRMRANVASLLRDAGTSLGPHVQVDVGGRTVVARHVGEAIPDPAVDQTNHSTCSAFAALTLSLAPTRQFPDLLPNRSALFETIVADYRDAYGPHVTAEQSRLRTFRTHTTRRFTWRASLQRSTSRAMRPRRISRLLLPLKRGK